MNESIKKSCHSTGASWDNVYLQHIMEAANSGLLIHKIDKLLQESKELKNELRNRR